MAELVAKYADAVYVASGDDVLTVFVRVVLQELVADKIGTDAHAVGAYADELVVVCPQIVFPALFVSRMLARSGIIDGDQGNIAVLSILGKVGSGLTRQPDGLFDEFGGVGVGGVSAVGAIVGVAVGGLHAGHHFEAGGKEAVALVGEIVGHAAHAIGLVVIAGLVEEARYLLLRRAGLEGHVGKFDHNDGDDGRTDAGNDGTGALPVAAQAVVGRGGTAHGAAG